MNQQKQTWMVALGLTGLFALWLLPGNWNLGWAVINSLFLIWVGRKIKGIRQDKFLTIIWWLSWGLGWSMAIRDFWFVRFLSLAGVIILNSILTTVGKKPRAKLGMMRLLKTNFQLANRMWEAWGGVMELVGKKKGNGSYTKLIKGLVLSIPLLLVFGGLFYGADPIFAKLVDQIKWPRIELDEELILNVIYSAVFFGVVVGMLRNKLEKQTRANKWLKSVTETNVAVTVLEILFVVFSWVQIRYFLATADDLRKLGIVFSEYTRAGYGQMIVAVLLAYAIVLRLEYSLRSQRKLGVDQLRWTKWLVWGMVAEILLFIVAATKRNWLYQAVYGFTEIRLLGFALSLWIVAAVVIVAVKVYKRRGSDFFVRGLILITGVGVMLLNVVDIDGTIVRAKPASLDSGVDYEYISRLSDDAWRGWKIVLREVEVKIETGGGRSIGEVLRDRQIISDLGQREATYREMAKSGWNWGGNWNYAKWRAMKEAERIRGRREEILQRLNQQLASLTNIQRMVAEEELREEVGQVVTNLETRYPGITWSLGGNTASEYNLTTELILRSNTRLDWEAFNRVAPSTCHINTEEMTGRTTEGTTWSYRLRCQKYFR